MTPEEREALVERMAEELWNAMPHATRYVKLTERAKELARSMARAALAVAEPVVREDEREACAKVADGTPYHGRYRTWPWWANPDGSQGNRENESDVVRHADAIADAIRARGDA